MSKYFIEFSLSYSLLLLLQILLSYW